MSKEKVFNATEVCKELEITIWTLTNWYQWERISLKSGDLSERILPIPSRKDGIKGRPRLWNANQIKQLKDFQSNIVKGRLGKMGKVTNPKSRHAKTH